MTAQPFIAACLQVNASNKMEENLQTACTFVREAKAQGAQMVFMPENVSMMEWGSKNIRAKAMAEEDHVALKTFQDLAKETGLWLHCGTLGVSLGEKVANRTYVLNPAGEIVAQYDKIHMFDVDLPGGESYRESATFQPGGQAILAPTAWGNLGLSVCYDLRFPHLYRSLAKAGADYLTVPAAFTRVTGRAHWHVLLRARAIETGCYVFAPAQCGTHANDRQTYGHALIIDPWGEILAEASADEPGIILATIDPGKCADVRAQVPSLQHDRPFALP